jgi:hypothetical protein
MSNKPCNCDNGKAMNVEQAKNLVILLQESMKLIQPIITSKDKEKLEELKNRFNEIYELLNRYVS